MSRSGQGSFRITPSPEDVALSYEAVCRAHIDAAINEYVRNGNLASALLLVQAAQDLMRGHVKNRGLSSIPNLESLLRQHRPGKTTEQRIKAIRMPYTATKHAVTKSDVAVVLGPQHVKTVMFLTAFEFGSVFGVLSPRMEVFWRWCTVVHDNLRSISAGAHSRFFPSASLEGDRRAKMGELMAFLTTVDEQPDLYPDTKSPLSGPISDGEFDWSGLFK